MGGLAIGPYHGAPCELSWVQITRFVAERAIRERLLTLYGNVQLRSGCFVTSLQHGCGGAQGTVTGACKPMQCSSRRI